MTAWSDLVKKLINENPGTPLKTLLPMAKKLYKKPDGKTMGKPMNFTSKRDKRGRRGNRKGTRRQR